MSIVISIIVLLGLFSLALLLKHPYKKLFGSKINPKYIPYFHLTGWGLLTLSIILSIYTYDIGIGITYWLGYVTLMAFILIVVFSYGFA